MTTATVLLAQVAPVPGDVDVNLRTAVDLVDGHPEVELAVFPELFVQGYRLAGIDDLAVPADGVWLEPLREAAARRRTGVVVGVAEHLPGRPPANSALCLDASGEVAGVYRKVHLFGAEAEHFTRGDRYLVVTMCGLRIGLMICYDVEFPEPARALTLAGAELLVTVSANMAPYQREHSLFSRARAVENRRPHVYVNRVGTESGFSFVGGSAVIDPAGEVPVALGDGEVIRAARVRWDWGAVPQPDYLADRRPDVPAVLMPGPPRPAVSITTQDPPSRAGSGGVR